MADALIHVDGLSIAFPSGDGERRVVDDVTFRLGTERLAIVGESGSGKSLTARALMGLIPQHGRVTAKRMQLLGEDLLTQTPRGWSRLRGARIGLVLQDPRFALNPLQTIGTQVEEALVLHRRISKRERRERVLAMLDAVGLPNGRTLYDLYPGQLSGGMGQRVMIAAMLIAEPEVLIADEPTSALDEALRTQILDLLARIADDRKMGLILISHDLQQVSSFADRALVLYRGRIVDEQPAAALAHSVHPYTATLWACRPSAATFGHRLPTLDRQALGDRP